MSPILAAAILVGIVGLIHSVLGERLVFRQLREHSDKLASVGLRERHVRILWATWHVVTIFGFAFGVQLVKIELGGATMPSLIAELKYVIAHAMLAASVLVLVMTKAKHPGWIGLLGVAILIYTS